MNQTSNSKPTLIFACSGASDVGELADRSARRLSRTGNGKMFCLAAVSARIEQYVDDTKAADKILAIDGCPKDCAKKTLSAIGVEPNAFNLEELGFEKGKSPASGESINKVCNYVNEKLT